MLEGGNFEVISHKFDLISADVMHILGTELFTYLCHLLITFANSSDPDQTRQNVWPVLDSNCLTLKEFFGKNVLKKISRRTEISQ